MEEESAVVDLHKLKQIDTAVLAGIPAVLPVAAERDAAMDSHVHAFHQARRVMMGRVRNEDPCPLCEEEQRQQQQQQQQQREQQQQQQDAIGWRNFQDTACAGASTGTHTQHSGNANGASCSSSGRCYRGGTSCSNSSSACSSSACGCNSGACGCSSSDHGCSTDTDGHTWQRPDPCGPFMWRQLVWRLFETLKPSAAAAMRLQGGCPHVDDCFMWNDIRESLRWTLLPLERAKDRDLFLHTSWEEKHAAKDEKEQKKQEEREAEVLRRVAQYARAISAKFAQVRLLVIAASIFNQQCEMIEPA